MSANNVEMSTDQRLLEFLIAEFETTFLDPKDPRAIMGQEIVNTYKENKTFSKSDLYKLDTLILSMQPTERLVQRADTLRLKYFDLAGTKIANAYRPAPLPTPDKYEDKAARNLLLADLQHVLRFIHWGYFFIPIREKIRTDVIISASYIMLGVTAIWAFVLFLCMNYDHSFRGLLITVVYAGLMGGFISSQRRMQMIPTQGDPLTSIYELENGKYFSWFAPLTGAVFSVILMLFFISGIVRGPIFPEFNEVASQHIQQPKTDVAKNETVKINATTSENKTDQTSAAAEKQSEVRLNGNYFEVQPKDVASYALLIIWSFIAGFAERFVPDTLDRLISRGASTEIGGGAGSLRSGGLITPSQAIPQVKSIQPPNGPASGGTLVDIIGSGFKNESSVNFGSTPATSTTVTNDSLITATSPGGKGLVNVTVTTKGGTSQIDSASQFTYDEEGTGTSLEDEGDTHLCDSDVPIQDITPDEELPIAKGGVA